MDSPPPPNLGYVDELSAYHAAGWGFDPTMPGSRIVIEALLGTTGEVLHRAIADVPVVFLTAYGDPATIARAVEASAFGYLIKPFDERSLAATLAVAFGGTPPSDGCVCRTPPSPARASGSACGVRSPAR